MKIDLRLGDCLEIMKTIPDGSIDAIITDPPYGTTACKWDSVIPFEPMWAELKRIIKPNGAIVLFGSQPFTSALIMSNPKMFKYEWIWEKSMPSNFCQASYQPMKYHENILVFSKNKTKYNPIMEDRSDIGKKKLKNNGKILDGSNNTSEFMNFKREKGIYRQYDPNKVNPKSVQKFKSVPNCNGNKLHPTQKPVALIEYLVKTYTNENETVLDFTMGSGTTGVACKNLNRNFIGIELDETYFNIAKERIEDDKNTLESFFNMETI
jgi:site-specific DNA-methyltransferase (adenine-specific)